MVTLLKLQALLAGYLTGETTPNHGGKHALQHGGGFKHTQPLLLGSVGLKEETMNPSVRSSDVERSRHFVLYFPGPGHLAVHYTL